MRVYEEEFERLNQKELVRHWPSALREARKCGRGILNSERAIAVNIEIMRAFVRLRQVLAQHADLAKRIDGLEAQMGKHQGENEHHFRIVFEAIRKLIDDEAKGSKTERIGFKTE